MMYGYGDDTSPLSETMALVDDIVVEYVTDLATKAQETTSKGGKLMTEDFLFLIRKMTKLAIIPYTVILETVFFRNKFRGVSTNDTVSVNYDDFVNDVEVGDMILVDSGMMSLEVRSKTKNLVCCEVVDGGELKFKRHLNVIGKNATLPSITDKDWEDIKFGVDNGVDFYLVSFVKDPEVVHELKNYLKGRYADIHVIVKIESADSIPNLHSILSASDGVGLPYDEYC